MKYEYQPKGVCASKIYLDVKTALSKRSLLRAAVTATIRGFAP